MTALLRPPVESRRKPARGWRGWRGPTEQKPFPSLGWAILDLTYEALPDPSDERKPFVFTDEQARRVIRWFEIHPVTGEYLHTTLILEEAKGWGKSPFAAALDIVDFVGPVCFDGWDADGEPVGVPWGTNGRPVPWLQIAAVSEDQTDNTYGALYALLTARDGKVAEGLRLDVGRTRVYHRDMPSAVLEPVTAAAGSREGQRITKVTMDETWLWKPDNGGTKLAGTLRRNISKMDGRAVETTNSPIIGQRSVAEQSDPEHPISGVLHYATRPSADPDPAMTDEQLEGILRDSVYRDVPWVKVPRLVRDIRDPRTPWDQSLRFFFNRRSAGVSRAIDPRTWDAQHVPGEPPAPGSWIALGFDGSVSGDATVLRGCTPGGWSFSLPGWSWVRPTGDEMKAWALAHPGEDWRVPRAEVDAAIAAAFATWDVGRMYADPPFWRDEITRWQRLYGDDVVLPFYTNSARVMAPAFDRWKTALAEGAHTHDGDPTVSDHVKALHQANARGAAKGEDGRIPVVPVKGDEARKIDGGLADILSYEAAVTMPEDTGDAGEPGVFVLEDEA